MEECHITRIDLANNVFQVHGSSTTKSTRSTNYCLGIIARKCSHRTDTSSIDLERINLTYYEPLLCRPAFHRQGR